METIVIMVLFGQSWEKWVIEFKILTPILHIIFTLAQLHGSKILFLMYKKEKLLLADEDKRLTDPETPAESHKTSDESERAWPAAGNRAP
jgi:hypothetical protein